MTKINQPHRRIFAALLVGCVAVILSACSMFMDEPTGLMVSFTSDDIETTSTGSVTISYTFANYTEATVYVSVPDLLEVQLDSPASNAHDADQYSVCDLPRNHFDLSSDTLRGGGVVTSLEGGQQWIVTPQNVVGSTARLSGGTVPVGPGEKQIIKATYSTKAVSLIQPTGIALCPVFSAQQDGAPSSTTCRGWLVNDLTKNVSENYGFMISRWSYAARQLLPVSPMDACPLVFPAPPQKKIMKTPMGRHWWNW